MRLPRPRGLFGQLTALLLLALVASQALTFLIVADERRWALDALRQQQIVERLGTVAGMLQAAPEGLRPRLAAAASSPEFALRLATSPRLEEPRGRRGRVLARIVARRLGVQPTAVRLSLEQGGTSLLPELRRWGDGDGQDDRDERQIWGRPWLALAVAVELAPGQWLEADIEVRPRPRGFAFPALVWLAVTAATVTLVVLLTTRRITRPVSALALAADRLGRGEALVALPERGPDEIRRATRAFNGMQARLRRFIDDRTRLLAALGHDLRTPITALRLRAEFVEDEEVRERLLETLDEMQQMVEATLAFARDEAASEPAREVDLAALVEGLCEDLRELGREVTFTGGGRLVARLRPMALKRALRNLIENAVLYGGEARVGVGSAAGEALIVIDDPGPGLPEEQLERVFEPFVRLELSRSRETGGVGLGLAIARSVVRAHGGEVALANRAEGGLRATVRLPLGADAA